MNTSTPSDTAAQAARDEELRGACAKAFTHYGNGHPRRGEKLLLKHLARHPQHRLLHYAYARLAHRRALEQRQPDIHTKQFDECRERVKAAGIACSFSLLPYLLGTQAFYDFPKHSDQALDADLDAVRKFAAAIAGKPLYAADIQYARAIATFDEEMFTLALFPDVRGCADSAAYGFEALACLAKAPAMITDLHRRAVRLDMLTPGQSPLASFVNMRDAEHAAEATRRLQRVEARARQEEGDRAREEEGDQAREAEGDLALVQRVMAVRQVMAGDDTAHDLQEAAAGWRESADQGDASPQFLVGVLYARGGGGVKKNLRLGKRYLELSAAAGSEDAVALLKELRKCVACGELDVHHMICSLCRNVRYCDEGCQRRHWNDPTDPHRLSCIPRRESTAVGAGSGNPRAAERDAGGGGGSGDDGCGEDECGEASG